LRHDERAAQPHAIRQCHGIVLEGGDDVGARRVERWHET
jgi:hypothetical protein